MTSSELVAEQKAKLRTAALTRRDALSPDERAAAAEAVAEAIDGAAERIEQLAHSLNGHPGPSVALG